MSDGRKTQLTINRVKVSPDGSTTVDRTKSFTAMLNPTDVKHERAIRYNTRMTLGQVGSETRFSGVMPDKVDFTLLLDGTGAVPTESDPGEVADQVKALNNVVYTYYGSEHQPDHVRVLWGTLILYGRMQSMRVEYTLFKPSGDPLRAKVILQFVGFMSTKEAELLGNRSSPDLTHVWDVREGDTLPLLCMRIYGDPGYVVDVARFNHLDSFRRLEPGTRLQFPPLE